MAKFRVLIASRHNSKYNVPTKKKAISGYVAKKIADILTRHSVYRRISLTFY